MLQVSFLSLTDSLYGFFAQYWPEIVIVVLGDILAIVIGEMLYERIHERRIKPRLDISIINAVNGNEKKSGLLSALSTRLCEMPELDVTKRIMIGKE